MANKLKAFDPVEFTERAAIMEYDGGLSREEAELEAAKAQGFQLKDVNIWLAELRGKRNG